MASLFKRLGSLLPARTRKGFAGYDLEGNSYFELPNPMGGRLKRTVEYKVNRDLAEYTSGQHRLPVQWTTWLSHTRSDPPTLQELESDSSRQTRLKPMIEAIEAREREERIRQGYLAAPDSEGAGAGVAGPAPARGIAGPSRINTRPSFTGASARASGPSQNEVPRQPYPVPTDPSPTVPPPPETVDPLKHDDPAELRRLAEEDTKRRIQQRGGEADLRGQGGAGDKVEGVGGGFAPRPRRRG